MARRKDSVDGSKAFFLPSFLPSFLILSFLSVKSKPLKEMILCIPERRAQGLLRKQVEEKKRDFPETGRIGCKRNLAVFGCQYFGFKDMDKQRSVSKMCHRSRGKITNKT